MKGYKTLHKVAGKDYDILHCNPLKIQLGVYVLATKLDDLHQAQPSLIS